MAARSTPPTAHIGPALLPVEQITQSILVFRGQKVLLDTELAALYGVTTKRLKRAAQAQSRALPRGPGSQRPRSRP